MGAIAREIEKIIVRHCVAVGTDVVEVRPDDLALAIESWFLEKKRKEVEDEYSERYADGDILRGV